LQENLKYNYWACHQHWWPISRLQLSNETSNHGASNS